MRTLHDICLLVLPFVIVELIENSFFAIDNMFIIINNKVSLAFSFVYLQLLIMLKSVFIVDGYHMD
jgi:hypothetical protein